MNLHKNPEKDLRRFSGLFFQIGLLSALLIIVSAFEWSTPETEPVVSDLNPDWDEIYLPPITDIEEKKPPKPKKINPVAVIEPKKDEQVDVSKILDWNDEQVITEPANLPEIIEDYADEPVDYTEEMPTPAGGYDAFYKYVSKNVKYTSRARNLNLQGKVFVQFVVERDGSITGVKIVRGLGAGLDEQAKQVMENAPNWNPGWQSGRRVKVRMIIPIHFKLE